MKKIFIFCGILVFIAGGLLAYSQLQKRNTQLQNPNDTGQTPASGPIGGSPQASATPLLSSEGAALQQKIAARIQSGEIPTETSPYLSQRILDVYPKGLGISQIPDYLTLFDDASQQISIQLNVFPLADTRTRAEQYLLEKLSITQNQACLLNIHVFVDQTVSTSLAGQNLGLSFCSGSVNIDRYTENIDGTSYSDQKPNSDVSL